MYIELIGYIGSVIIVISMLMTSVMKLRIINMTGGIIFTTYAFLIRSYPTAIMNGVLAIINCVNIFMLVKKERKYSITKLNPSDSFLRFFLYQYEADIRKFFPDMDVKKIYDYAYLVCYKSTPAGIFLGLKEGENSIAIKIDYVTPEFRDCSIGTYLYDFIAEIKTIRQLTFENPSSGHEPYLLKMGFKKHGEKYIKEL